MKMIRCNTLSNEQISQIQELERICNENDGLENHVFLSNEINYNKEIPTFFFAYEGPELIGFLTFFIPTSEEAEISAIVHPLHRQRKVFTQLDGMAREVIAENRIGRTLYSVETKSASAARVLKRWGISELIRSEYRMQINLEQFSQSEPRVPGGMAASVRRVTPENIVDYLKISDRAFGADENSAYANAAMTSDTRIGYVFYQGKKPVGVFTIGLETKDEPFVYGVAVAESERGKGYGRRLMEQACSVGRAYGNTLCLDVDSHNPVAFHLYRSLGFEITFQVDYYMHNHRVSH